MSRNKLEDQFIGAAKKSTPVEDVCKGCPKEFHMYLHYCRGLRFNEKPDYNYLRKLFNGLFNKLGHEYDWKFDWTIGTKNNLVKKI
jgi:hypothetical protein